MIRESRRATVIFEPDQGWVPVDTQGTVWRYRTRGSSGVVVFKRDGEGQGAPRSYEATHVDRFSNDETITTARRRKAVRFAVSGTTKRNQADARLPDRKGQGLAREPAAADAVALGAAAPQLGLRSDPAPADPSQDPSSGVADVRGPLYAAEAYVVELRRGQYWVDVPEHDGTLAFTADPSRASTVASADRALLGETFAAVPTARVLKIRVTVTEVLDHADRA